ncbi:MAG: GIN domain-containing protein, partial [Pyrinomonadaceae bacterium]
DLKNTSLNVDTNGASKIELAGETDKLAIEVSGASKINAENLKARAATVNSSGASKIDLFATESLRVDASGASKITYAGGATDVVKNTSGASRVSPK